MALVQPWRNKSTSQPRLRKKFGDWLLLGRILTGLRTFDGTILSLRLYVLKIINIGRGRTPFLPTRRRLQRKQSNSSQPWTLSSYTLCPKNRGSLERHEGFQFSRHTWLPRGQTQGATKILSRKDQDFKFSALAVSRTPSLEKLKSWTQRGIRDLRSRSKQGIFGVKRSRQGAQAYVRFWKISLKRRMLPFVESRWRNLPCRKIFSCIVRRCHYKWEPAHLNASSWLSPSSYEDPQWKPWLQRWVWHPNAGEPFRVSMILSRSW